jgi:fructokinase
MHLAIEVGGTSIRLATVDSELKDFHSLSELTDSLKNTQSIPFELFEVTLSKILNYCEGTIFNSIGISSFGPICLMKNSEKFGEITSGACDVKKTWLNKSLALKLGQSLNISKDKIYVDTDVNGACLAEI